MAVLERSELQASTLSDLHAIADQLGLDGFRRLRKAELIEAILGNDGPPADDPDSPGSSSDESPVAVSEEPEEAERDRSQAPRSRRRGGRSTAGRSRRSSASAKDDDDAQE